MRRGWASQSAWGHRRLHPWNALPVSRSGNNSWMWRTGIWVGIMPCFTRPSLIPAMSLSKGTGRGWSVLRTSGDCTFRSMSIMLRVTTLCRYPGRRLFECDENENGGTKTLLTPTIDGRAFKAIEDFTSSGTQSVKARHYWVDHPQFDQFWRRWCKFHFEREFIWGGRSDQWSRLNQTWYDNSLSRWHIWPLHDDFRPQNWGSKWTSSR